MSEAAFIRHCSPTLAGLKTASLFTSTYSSEAEVTRMVRRLNQTLGPRGLKILPLRYAKGRVLIYVYRPSRLTEDLKGSFASGLLESRGYPCGSAEGCVARLARRLKENGEFPHEIGLFLGYPPEDVRGFIENRGGACKCTGFWKVYGDEEQARKKFAKYRKCTDVYWRQWTGGTSIERLTVAV